MKQIKYPDATFEKTHAVWQLSGRMRGRYLDRAIVIEGIIDSILAELLCYEEQEQYLLRSLLTRVRMQDKIQFLVAALDKLLPDKSSLCCKLKKEAEKMRTFRNKLAHSLLDVDMKWLEGRPQDQIRLISFPFPKGDRKSESLTEAGLSKKIWRSDRLLYKLFEIQNAVHARAQERLEKR